MEDLKQEATEPSRASERATEKLRTQMENEKAAEDALEEITEVLEEPVAVTTVDAFMSSTQAVVAKGAVKTPSGFTMEIRSLDPGELATMLGSPLFVSLIEQTASGKKPELTDKKAIELVSDPSMMEGIKRIVCMGVTSIPFVDKPEAECNMPDEVPISRLPFVDLMITFNAICELSQGKGGAELFRYFQGTIPDEAVDGDTTPSNE